jgi:Dolichyl-phosphate-mannose-protein mannosyltransferase
LAVDKFRTSRGLILLGCWAISSTIIGRSYLYFAHTESDPYLFAYIGFQWRDGHIPYIEIWDHKPPGIFAVNALIFHLFPKSFTALTFVEALYNLGCIATVYLLIRQLGAPLIVASFATASVSIASNLFFYHYGGNFTEVYLLWPATLSMYFFSKASPAFQGKWVLLAGFCSGLAALFKPVGLSPLLAQETFVFLLWAVCRGVSGQQLLGSALANSVGTLIAWLPFMIYFRAHNALGEFVDASLIYNLYYAAASYVTNPRRSIDAVFNLQPLASVVVCVIIGAGFCVSGCTRVRHNRAGEERSTKALWFWWPLALLWVVFDLAGALAGGRGYQHYFLPLTASLSVAAGFTYWFLIGSFSGAVRQAGIDKVIFALVLGPLLLPQMSDIHQFMRWVLFPSERHVWTSDEKAVATYLNAVRGPSDTLFTWDYMPIVYFTTEMKSPVRLLHAHYILHSQYSHSKFGEEILRGLQQTPPTFLVENMDNAIGESLTTGDSVYRKFREFIQHNYVWIHTAGTLTVYRHEPSRVSFR